MFMLNNFKISEDKIIKAFSDNEVYEISNYIIDNFSYQIDYNSI